MTPVKLLHSAARIKPRLVHFPAFMADSSAISAFLRDRVEQGHRNLQISTRRANHFRLSELHVNPAR
jgi:hypothetical protein